MNSTARTIVVIALLGVALGAGYWLGARAARVQRRPLAPTADAGAPAKPGEREVAVLPQPDGPARHLAGAQEGPDGDGLHRLSTKARTRARRARSRCRADRIQTLGVRTEPVSKRSLGARRSRRRHHRNQRTRAAHRRAEVRGLDREAARQHHRPGRWLAASRWRRSTAPNSFRRSVNTLIAYNATQDAERCGLRCAGWRAAAGHCVAGTAA